MPNFYFGTSSVRSWFAGLSVALSVSCGVRSSFPDLEPCFEAGATRECKNACGSGVEQCSAGYWQACAVATKSTPCNNQCGTGTATCTDGVWSACEVAPTTRECSDTCGIGTQTCTHDVWQPCVVPDTSQECRNDCGTGQRTCSNRTWSDCIVAHQEETCSSVCGNGKRTCDNGVWSTCDAPQPLPPKLQAVVRDFKADAYGDFGHPNLVGSADDRGLVQSLLGSDDTPVYAFSGASLTVQSRESFSEWYHDVSGVNMSTAIDLPLRPASDRPGLFIYENHSFFPIDNQLFGNEGLEHNYNFTLAASATFTYLGNELFTFSGDDDVFVFINRHLAIDLGGIHNVETATVDLAARAQELQIAVGNRYPIHIFFAERHPVLSDFVVETSIADIGACP